MKSEYFRSPHSNIRGSREKEPPKSVNWDRIVYLTLLAAAMITIVYFLFDYNYIVKGEGRVYANQHQVRFPVDVHLLDIYVEEGDTVAANDSLFSFVESLQPESPQQYRDEKRQVEERLTNIEGEISNQRAEINQIDSKLEYYQEQKKLVEKEVKLGLSTVGDLRSIEQKMMTLKADRTVGMEKLNSYYRERTLLEKWENSLALNRDVISFTSMKESSGGKAVAGELIEPMLYTTPVPGVVERIDKTRSELAIRSETILRIRRNMPDIFIQVIFPRSSLKEIDKGDVMNVDFDNGKESRGIIAEFYTPQIKNWDAVGITEYEINDYVVMKIKPEDSTEMELWKKNSNIGVTVSKIIL